MSERSCETCVYKTLFGISEGCGACVDHSLFEPRPEDIPQARPESYWWCPECKREVDWHNVTFEEFHDACGTAVISKLVTPQVPEVQSEIVSPEALALLLKPGLCDDESCANCRRYVEEFIEEVKARDTAIRAAERARYAKVVEALKHYADEILYFPRSIALECVVKGIRLAPIYSDFGEIAREALRELGEEMKQ